MRYRYKVLLNMMAIGTLALLGFFTWEGNAFSWKEGISQEQVDVELFPRYREGLKELFPGSSALEKLRSQVYRIKDGNGNELGLLYLETVPEEERKSGYAGVIEVAVAVRDGKVVGVLIGRNEDTPGVLARVAGQGLPEKLERSCIEGDSNDGYGCRQRCYDEFGIDYRQCPEACGRTFGTHGKSNGQKVGFQ